MVGLTNIPSNTRPINGLSETAHTLATARSCRFQIALELPRAGGCAHLASTGRESYPQYASMWSDRETIDDCLSFPSFRESPAGACLKPEIAPLAMENFGSSSSGETSPMQMLRVRLETRTSSEAGIDKPEFVTLRSYARRRAKLALGSPARKRQ